MRLQSRSIVRIIVLALIASVLAACSSLRFGYRQGPELAYWWLDGYASFDDSQAPAVRDAVAGWFRWHRSTQLVDYAALLDKAAAEALGPVTSEQVCGWSTVVSHRLSAAFEEAVPEAAGIALKLGPEQLAAIERKNAKNIAEFREDVLDGPPARRAERQLDRTEERFERFYGALDRGQLEQIGGWLGESPFDPERSLAERMLRQQDLLDTIRRLTGEHATQAQAEAALRGFASRVEQSPREPYRAYVERSKAFNCELVARVHAIATPAQRQTASDRLKGWAGDLRSLVDR